MDVSNRSRMKWKKTRWKCEEVEVGGMLPFAYVVQSCALELNYVRYGKEQNWKTEGKRKEGGSKK